MSSPVRLSTFDRPPSPIPHPRVGGPAARLDRLTASELDFSQFLTTAGQPTQSTDATSYVWGTLIELAPTLEKIANFISSFTKDDQSQPHYLSLIQQALDDQTFVLNLDCQNILLVDEDLYTQMVTYPQELIPIFDLVIDGAVKQSLAQLDPNEAARFLTKKIEVRPFNLGETKAMRTLGPEDLDKLVQLKGMLIRTSPVIPDIRIAFFECVDCKQNEVRPIERGKINEPVVCPNCRSRNTMALVHNRCVFADKQYIKLQETPDSIPDGGTPQTVTLAVYDTLVDVSYPGDKIVVTGIFRATPIRPNSAQRAVKQVFKTYIDVLHFSKSERNRMTAESVDTLRDGQKYRGDDEVQSVVEERERYFVELSKRDDIYPLLTKAFAPSIWEMDEVKKGILCLLFGGTPMKNNDVATGKFRGEINVLMCGDPGTSKSQLLQYVHKIAPRGLYTSGKGSSAVGLTAYISRDPDSGEHVLESGALVLSDRGVCCIDEFDKMSDHTRSILHEAMEQQTVSVAKAGIICTLNARTSILASANPRESKYNPMLSVVDNIQLPPTLLSRFDLIYLVLDTADEVKDTKLARHIVSLYFLNPPETGAALAEEIDAGSTALQTLPTQTLALYIAYARRVCHPQISDAAGEALVKGYIDMRRRGESQKTITATTRQLESLIRLSEAHAKMRLSQTVTPEDVEEAIRLMKLATHKAATDPRTGLIDMDMLNTGHGARHNAEVALVKQRLLELINQHFQLHGTDEHLSADRLMGMYTSLSTEGELPRDEFNQALAALQEEELIALSGERNRLIKKLA